MRPGRTSYVPDLFTPKPPTGPWARTLTQQFEVIRETSDEAVIRQLLVGRYATEPMPSEVRHAMEDGTFALRATNGLHRFWRATLAEQWNALDEAIVADIGHRGRTMATHGVGRLLESLHPELQWTGDQLRIDKPYEETTDFADAELVLAPSVLGWPHLRVQVCDPDNGVAMYPVREFTTGRQVRTPTLANLLGASRAAILDGLNAPSSTTELSRRHGLAPSTVSYHLSVLLGAGMVARGRKGLLMEYRRSQQGDALVRNKDAPTSDIPVVELTAG